MHWKTATAEHIGKRFEQQDRAAIFESADGQRYLLALADGMGGHQGGALAAETLVKVAGEQWEREADNLVRHHPERFLKQVCFKAHQEINRVGKAQELNPHSTCVLLLLSEIHAWWSHLGDSRLYHFREGRLLRRTRDHSLVQMLVDMGRIREEEMATHQDQGCLLRGLGGNEISEPECGGGETQPGDVFILCSDGLWEHVSPEEMHQTLDPGDLPHSAARLVTRAFSRGGEHCDNITLAVAWRED